MSPFDFGKLFSSIPNGLPPAEHIAARNKIVTEAFPLAVQKAGWRLLMKGDAPASTAGEQVIVVGVALYSEKDLLALECLVQRRLPKAKVVFVLNLDLLQSEPSSCRDR